MNLRHYSSADTITVESRDQGGATMKPVGLWVTDESEGSYGWASWCTDNQYDLGPNAFAVDLSRSANILRLDTPQSIVDLNDEFGAPDGYYLRWTSVAERWQGIIISPYQWSMRLSHVNWYYGWDCASGCIWDASAIQSISPIAADAIA